MVWRSLDRAGPARNDLAGPPQEKTILWISDGYDGVEPGTNNDQRFVDLLTGHGYTVVRKDHSAGMEDSLRGPRDYSRRTLLDGADLVIVSRCARSDDYNFPGDWNDLTVPLILLTPYLALADRWRWFDTDSWDLPVGMPAIQATPDQSIFDHVSLDGNGRADILTTDTSQVNLSTAGNGVVIARRADDGGVWMAQWPAGTEFYGGAGQRAGGERMCFAAGDYHWDPPMTGGFNLNAQGQQIFLNAVASLADPPVVPEPSTWAMLAAGLLGAGVFCRRRSGRLQGGRS